MHSVGTLPVIHHTTSAVSHRSPSSLVLFVAINTHAYLEIIDTCVFSKLVFSLWVPMIVELRCTKHLTEGLFRFWQNLPIYDCEPGLRLDTIGAQNFGHVVVKLYLAQRPCFYEYLCTSAKYSFPLREHIWC